MYLNYNLPSAPPGVTIGFFLISSPINLLVYTNFNREEILDQVDHQQKTDNFQEKDEQVIHFF